MTDSNDERPASKVARLIDEYDLGGLGADLETRWTDDGDGRMSLRDLADYFNVQLLERRVLDAGASAIDQDVETVYRNITDADVSSGVRTDTRNRLERDGIDVDALQSDFVSYQAIRTYLTEWRDAEYEGLSAEEKIEKDRESVQRLLSRTHTVIEDRIESLRDTERLDVGEFEVFLDAEILCQECGTQHSVGDLLDQGGCSCQTDH